MKTVKLFVTALVFTFSYTLSAQTVSTICNIGGNPEGICTDASGNIYVTDKNNHCIKKISTTGSVTVFAGTAGSSGSSDGTLATAKFNTPSGLAINALGDIFVTDYGNNKIRKISSAGQVTTFAGSGTAGAADGIGTSAAFSGPWGICLAPDGNLYVTDQYNFKIRRISPTASVSSIPAGLAFYFGICADANNNLFFANRPYNQIMKLDQLGNLTVFAGLSSGNSGNQNGNGNNASFYGPIAITYGPDGNFYVAESGGVRVRRITPNADVTTVAGTGGQACIDGPITSATFWGLSGITFNAAGDILLTDYFCTTARKITGINTLPSSVMQDYADQNSMTVFPNPSDGIFSLTSVQNVKMLELTSLSGQIVYKTSEPSSTIQVNALPPGIYTLSCTLNNQTQIHKKVIIKK